jgi:tetratricopeptide (TPR) repeat protein
MLAPLLLALLAAPPELAEGIRRFQAGDYLAAQQAFESALPAAGAEGWRWLGMTRAVQGLNGRAELAFEKACQLDSRTAENCYYLGRARYENNRFEGAIEAHEAALKARRDWWRALQGLGLALEALGRNEAAESTLRKAVERSRGQAPPEFDPRVDLGVFYFRQGNAPAALIVLKEALKDAPASGRALFETGKVYAALGEDQQALELLRRAVAANPSAAPAHLLLGKVCIRLGLVEEGRKHAAIGNAKR